MWLPEEEGGRGGLTARRTPGRRFSAQLLSAYFIMVTGGSRTDLREGRGRGGEYNTHRTKRFSGRSWEGETGHDKGFTRTRWALTGRSPQAWGGLDYNGRCSGLKVDLFFSLRRI